MKFYPSQLKTLLIAWIKYIWSPVQLIKLCTIVFDQTPTTEKDAEGTTVFIFDHIDPTLSAVILEAVDTLSEKEL